MRIMTETKDNRVASNQTLNLFRAADTAVGRINSLQHAIGNRATQKLLRSLVPSERTGVMVQRQQAQPVRTVQERADNIIAELGPLIMSDRVVLDNLQGTGMEDVLRRIDSVTEAGFTYLTWMLKRVDGSEKQELVNLLLDGVSSPDLRGRLVVICCRDLYGTNTEEERLLVTMAERMTDSELHQDVISPGVSTDQISDTVDDPDLRLRIDNRLQIYLAYHSNQVEQQVTQGLERLADQQSRAEQSREMEIISAQVDLTGDFAVAFSHLRDAYSWRSQNQANTPEERAGLRRQFEEQLGLIQDSYRMQFELGLRYGVIFTTGQSLSLFSSSQNVMIFDGCFWSRDELARMDTVLQRVPRGYLSRIRKIQRAPRGNDSSAAASWDEATSTLEIYDQGFDIGQEQFELYVLHEIGHSVEPSQTQGTFRFLPNSDWMALSDWRMSTRDTLGADLGISGEQLQQILDQLDLQTRFSAGIPPPIFVNGRAVVWDKYEPNPGPVPTQFFHYDQRYDDQFVSAYARRHPDEDFAESFALYMQDPEETQSLLDQGPSGTVDKWDYLTQHFPDRLQQ